MLGDIPNVSKELLYEFPDSALGIIGCQATGEGYPPCEHDYLVVSGGEKRVERRVIADRIVDILFVNEDALADPLESRLQLALIDLCVISDSRWCLRPLASQAKNEAVTRLRRSAHSVIFEALTALGRFNDSIRDRGLFEADFWLKISAYRLATAFIASSGIVPRRSHLLAEFRRGAEGSGGLFGLWSEILGLDLATKVTTIRRLDALREISASNNESELTYRLAEARVNYLMKSHAVVDAYCYLGAEMMNTVEERYESSHRISSRSPVYRDIFDSLVGKGKNLPMQTIRLFGLTSDESKLRDRGQRLQDAVRSVAKRLAKDHP